MVKIGRGHADHFVLLLCALLALGSIALFHATRASAGALEGVTGTVEETVGGPVPGVTESVTPPVDEVTETVTQPVQVGTEAAAPPVHEATETVAAPAREITETVIRPAKEATAPVAAPVKKVTETVASAAAPVKVPAPSTAHVPTQTSGSGSGMPVVREATGTAIHGAQGRVGPVTQGVPAGRAPAGSDDRGRTSGPRDEVLRVPSSDGSVRAPLPKWMAYIWPAIALRAPAFADLLGHWEQDGLRLVLGVFGTAAGSGDGQVVAGVHASGGRSAAPDSSSSSFPKVPSVVPLAFPNDDGWQALAELLIVAATLLAVAVAVRREILAGHRHGRER